MKTPPPGITMEEDDERLARLLQEEEDRSINGPSQAAQNQELEDLLLARRMAGMDTQDTYAREQFEIGNEIAMALERGQDQQQERRVSGSREAAFLRENNLRQNSESFEEFVQKFGRPAVKGAQANKTSTRTNSDLRRSISDISAFERRTLNRQTSEESSGHLRDKESYVLDAPVVRPRRDGDMEERLAYARQLQEQALSNVRTAPTPSTEEADLELALRIQMEEEENSQRGTRQRSSGSAMSKESQETGDMELARFIEESGMSFTDLDLADVQAMRSSMSLAEIARGPPMQPHQGMSPYGQPGMSPYSPYGPPSQMPNGLYGGGGATAPGVVEIVPNDSELYGVTVRRRPEPSRLRNVPETSGGRPHSSGRESATRGISPRVQRRGSTGGQQPRPRSPRNPASTRGRPDRSPAAGSSLHPPQAEIPQQLSTLRLRSSTSDLPPFNSRAPPGAAETTPRTNPQFFPKPGRRTPVDMDDNFSDISSSSKGGKAASSTDESSPRTPRLGRLLGRQDGSNQEKKDRSKSRGRTARSRSGGNLHELVASARNPLGPQLMDGEAQAEEVEDEMFLRQDEVLGMTTQKKEKDKKKGGGKKRFLGKMLGLRGNHDKKTSGTEIAAGIPAAIPARPDIDEAFNSGLPYSVSTSSRIEQHLLHSSEELKKTSSAACAVCGVRTGKMISAMDKKFHLGCFRCMSCNEEIDPASIFAVSVDSMGEKRPMHRKCYAEFYGVRCAVCKQPMPANEDGTVSFIKHPFFDNEQMCPRHADEDKRRCTACHRFEPDDEPFLDLNEQGRCVCYACCRTVIMNNLDIKSLWDDVMNFFDVKLELPIWPGMRSIPILVVGQDALNESQIGTAHEASTQIMTRGICLSEQDAVGINSFRSTSMRFNDSTSSFEACDAHSRGYADVNPFSSGGRNSQVMAILCLSGLPQDLAASVLAHEATHAWINLHPEYDSSRPVPVQLEEGCAQLISYLFLSEGLAPAEPYSGPGPSDEKLRQYFKYCIETDDSESYGDGYRKAAAAYAEQGIQALMTSIVHYHRWPQ